MSTHRKGPATSILIAEYTRGATSPELARKYGMTHGGICGRLDRAGISRRPARRRCILDSDRETIIQAYRDGESIKDLAARFGGAKSSLHRALLDAGLELRPRGTRTRSIRIPTDPVALGYLCGLFDGEGHLQFTKKHSGRSLGCKLSIYSTTIGVIEWLTFNVGGKVLWDHARFIRKGWKPIGSWNLYRAQDVAALLFAMLPHLIVKKPVAESALALFKTRFKVYGQA